MMIMTIMMNTIIMMNRLTIIYLYVLYFSGYIAWILILFQFVSIYFYNTIFHITYFI